jgi:hypothetical protein
MNLTGHRPRWTMQKGTWELTTSWRRDEGGLKAKLKLF